MEQHRAGPQVQIEAVACRKTGFAGHWLVSWHIETPEEQTLEIQAAWLPHDKFHSDRQGFEPPLHLNKKESATLELLVACEEPPGAVVENAFVILQLVWLGQSWRAFARHHVAVDMGGVPQPGCEAVTVHPIGPASSNRPEES